MRICYKKKLLNRMIFCYTKHWLVFEYSFDKFALPKTTNFKISKICKLDYTKTIDNFN